MKRFSFDRPGPSNDIVGVQSLPLSGRSNISKLRRTTQDHKLTNLNSSSTSSESDDDVSEYENEGKKKTYRKIRRDSRRQLQENGIILNWKNLQMLAERDNYKNHLRESMMSANNPPNNVVENAGVLMAIEEFGLQQRLNPLLRYYGLDDTSELSSVSGISSTDSDVTDSSFSSQTSESSRKRIKPHLSTANAPNISSDANFSFEDFAVNAAINTKGLSL